MNSGISAAKEKPQKGEVVAVGQGKLNDKNERQPMDVKVGDKILYAKYAGTDVKVDGVEYKILSVSDALAVNSYVVTLLTASKLGVMI